jgi:hypothetical protein
LRALTVYLVCAVALFGYDSVHWYFREYTPLHVYGNFHGVIGTALGKYAHAKLGPDWRIYYFAEGMSVDFASITFLAPEVEGVNVRQRLDTVPTRDLVKGDKRPAFVFTQERRAELELVKQAFPGGIQEEAPDPRGGNRPPLFTVYRIVS